MQKSYILALDQGTTSSRAILFDHDGAIHACCQQEFRQIYPQPGWVEHDPNDIWESQLGVAQQALRKAGVAATQVAAIGIANQRETTAVWDRKSGQPVANAIVWQDRRTADHCGALRAGGHAASIRDKTGLLIDAYFSATKLRWLLDHIPNGQALAEGGDLAFGTIDAWLAFKLCGEHVCDVSNASRTLLFNIHTRDWDDELLTLFSIPRAILPRVVDSSGVIGATDVNLFGAVIPVAGLSGDQQAASFGQVCVRPGMAKNTYGTGCFLLLNTGTNAVVSQNNLLTTLACSGAAQVAEFMLEGSVFMAGATVQWLRDELGLIREAAEIEALASSVPDAGGVVLVPAFAGLGAPHWDPDARGMLAGLTRGANRAHIARAALDSIALQTVELVQAMEADSGVRLSELRVDGGASRNDLLLQLQADYLGVPVLRPKVTETTGLGAAYLAGLAVGFWGSMAEIAQHWQLDRYFEPRISDAERVLALGNWLRAVERAKSWLIR